jgi:cation:H+ antiporter
MNKPNGIIYLTQVSAKMAGCSGSYGLTSVKLGDYKLAVSNIFGSNAFLSVLLPVASLLSGQAVPPQATDTDIYLTGLGILLTTVYIWGLILRPYRKFLRMGIDSLVVFILYLLGVAGGVGRRGLRVVA